MLPAFDRADRIGSYYGNPATRIFAELLIDCEEDGTPRAVVVGMLRQDDRGRWARREPAPRGEPDGVGHISEGPVRQ